MLNDFHTLISAIEAGDLTEADVYKSKRLYRRPRVKHVAPGDVHCPICGTSALRFLPFGLARRPNAQCPTCGSVERHRFLWLYLQRRTDFFRRRAVVLHTAPEPALAAPFQSQHGHGYVSVDAFNPYVDVQGDLICLPFKDSHFDIVISCHVLEHIKDDRKAIRELARVLRPAGWAVIMVPFDPGRATYEDLSLTTAAERKAVFGHPFHYRSYGHDLVSRLAEAGLNAKVVESNKLLIGHERRRWRINRNYLMFCRKTSAKKLVF